MQKKEASEQKAAKENAGNPSAKKAEKPAPVKEPAPPSIKPQPIDKEKQKEQRKLQRRFEELETSISSMQEEKKLLEDRLAEPEVYSNVNLFQETEKKYAEINQAIGKAEAEYERVFEKLSDF
jgi:ATP-binding cassette subfamily F protein 3